MYVCVRATYTRQIQCLCLIHFFELVHKYLSFFGWNEYFRSGCEQREAVRYSNMHLVWWEHKIATIDNVCPSNNMAQTAQITHILDIHTGSCWQQWLWLHADASQHYCGCRRSNEIQQQPSIPISFQIFALGSKTRTSYNCSPCVMCVCVCSSIWQMQLKIGNNVYKHREWLGIWFETPACHCERQYVLDAMLWFLLMATSDEVSDSRTQYIHEYRVIAL